MAPRPNALWEWHAAPCEQVLWAAFACACASACACVDVVMPHQEFVAPTDMALLFYLFYFGTRRR